MKSISKLVDGKKGIVFKIVNDDDTEQVIKLQGENPASAIVASEMLKDVGVNAPTTESVKGEDLTNFQQELNAFMEQASLNQDQASLGVAKQLSECLEKASAPNTKYTFPHVVRMDFASGDSLGTALKNREQFKQMMTNPQFAQQLGMIMAGDAYTGNGDRLMSMNKVENFQQQMMPGGAAKLSGWLNPGNLIIEGEGKDLKLKAIDNAITPGMNLSAGKLQGNHAGVMQYGSLAAANPAQFKRELFAIAELMEQQAGIKLSPQELHDFIKNASEGALEVIEKTLKNPITPEQLKLKMQENGASEETSEYVAESFGPHQQMMKMLAGSLQSDARVQPTVREMMKIANEKKTDGEALELLDSLGAKKAMEGMDEKQVERFTNLLKGERGTHVPKDFKLTIKEAELMAKDESVYKQFTHKSPSMKI
jgi:hypothetical protein